MNFDNRHHDRPYHVVSHCIHNFVRVALLFVCITPFCAQQGNGVIKSINQNIPDFCKVPRWERSRIERCGINHIVFNDPLLRVKLKIEKDSKCPLLTLRQTSYPRYVYDFKPFFSDGFRCDKDGNVWTSAGKAIKCFNPQNELIGQLIVPELVSNLEFGGLEGNILYVTATTSLYSIELNQQGARFYE